MVVEIMVTRHKTAYHMQYRIGLWLTLSLAAADMHAQMTTVEPVAPSITFSAGYGFPSFTRTVFNFVEGENVESMVIGPLYGKAEFALSDRVGLGVNFAYTHGNATYVTQDGEIDSIFYNTSVDYTSYSVLARLNFHFGRPEGIFDPYAGLGLGYRNARYDYTGGDPDDQPVGFDGLFHLGMDLTIGTRVYLTENIGLYGEVGLAKSIMQAGLVVRL